jgi:transcriptional regulator with XRE-family HTH domain
MKLKRYIHEQNLSPTDAARALNVSPEAVYNWTKGKRIPRKDEMKSIFVWSNGHVRPDDFYDLPSLDIGPRYQQRPISKHPQHYREVVA